MVSEQKVRYSSVQASRGAVRGWVIYAYRRSASARSPLGTFDAVGRLFSFFPVHLTSSSKNCMQTSLNCLKISLSSSCVKVLMNEGFLSQASQPLTLSKSAEFMRISDAYSPSRSSGSSFLISSNAFVRSSVQDKLSEAPADLAQWERSNLALFPPNSPLTDGIRDGIGVGLLKKQARLTHVGLGPAVSSVPAARPEWVRACVLGRRVPDCLKLLFVGDAKGLAVENEEVLVVIGIRVLSPVEASGYYDMVIDDCDLVMHLVGTVT